MQIKFTSHLSDWQKSKSVIMLYVSETGETDTH